MYIKAIALKTHCVGLQIGFFIQTFAQYILSDFCPLTNLSTKLYKHSKLYKCHGIYIDLVFRMPNAVLIALSQVSSLLQ